MYTNSTISRKYLFFPSSLDKTSSVEHTDSFDRVRFNFSNLMDETLLGGKAKKVFSTQLYDLLNIL